MGTLQTGLPRCLVLHTLRAAVASRLSPLPCTLPATLPCTRHAAIAQAALEEDVEAAALRIEDDLLAGPGPGSLAAAAAAAHGAPASAPASRRGTQDSG